jgi:hypothetical protein
MDLDNMFNCICKEYQIHSFASIHCVKLFEHIHALLRHKFTICELAVDVGQRLLGIVTIRVDHGREGAEEQRLDLDKIIQTLLELLRSLLFEELQQLVTILLRDETVLEHSHALMGPEFDCRGLVSVSAGIRFRDALEDLRHITQVVCVMGLGRCRAESLLNLLIRLDRGHYDIVLLRLDRRSVLGLSR